MAAPTMKAVVTTGIGGYDRLEYRDVPVPIPGPGEVVIRVLAAGVNNTDVNTRLGWYSPTVTDGTDGTPAVASVDGGWNGPTPFPLIQGTDCCGVVEDVASGVDEAVVGRRVLVRPCMRAAGFESMDTMWLGSDLAGAFAQYLKVPVGEVFPVDCDWSDAQLGGVPCAGGTAENMLHRADVGPGDRVVVTGASGGVGSAAVQIARARGAYVVAVCSPAKADAVAALGADRIVGRNDLSVLGGGSIDVVVDTVAGPGFGAALAVLRRGGRYVTSGAIAGPLVELDVRTLYLNDLTLIGATAWAEPVFPRLIGLIESGSINPPAVETFPLFDMAQAQRRLLERSHVGRIVLIPPTPDGV
ncbi:MAG: zinc-binding dehydrogenase [Acidimicrobiia bacterium]